MIMIGGIIKRTGQPMIRNDEYKRKEGESTKNYPCEIIYV